MTSVTDETLEDVLDLYAEAPARIKWMFTTDKARAKMGRAYPQTFKESEPL